MPEERLNAIEKSIVGIESDLKYIKEGISGFIVTHEEVIRTSERVKVVNKRLQEIDILNEKQQKEITDVMVKTAGIAAFISVILGVFIKSFLD